MSRKHMRGVYVVEFALVSGFLFVLLLGVLEFGRLYFTVNTLDEVVRRGARLAAVCDPTSAVEQNKILQRAIFNEATGSGASPLLSGLQASNLSLVYLKEDGSNVAGPNSIITTEQFRDIRFVRVSVVNYSYNQAFLGVISGLLRFLGELFDFESEFDGTITLPTFQSTLPRESLGRHPEGSDITPC